MASRGRKPAPIEAAPVKPAAKAPKAPRAKPMAAAKPPVVTPEPVKPEPVKAAEPVVVPKPARAVATRPAKVLAAPTIESPAPAPVPDPVIVSAAEQAAETPAPTDPSSIDPAPINPAPVAIEAPVAFVQKEVITMEATIKNAAEKAQTMFTEVNARAKAAVEKSTKLFEEANEFSKGNVEAMVESGKIAAKGMETLGQEAADYSRKQFEGATAVLKSLSGAKSPTDFFKLHSDYVRASFDSMVAQTSKSTEAMIKLAGDVAQPISTRVSLAAEKVKIAA